MSTKQPNEKLIAEAIANSVTFQPDSQPLRLLTTQTVGDQSLATLWEVGEEKADPLRDFPHGEDHVAFAVFTEDGGKLLTLSDESILRIWDVETGDLIRRESPPK